MSTAEDGLSGQAALDFYEAVCDAYEEDSFRRLLLFRCKRRGLDVLSNGRGFKDNVSRVFEVADEEGWLRAMFIPAVLADRPDNEKIRLWVRAHYSYSSWSGGGTDGPSSSRRRDALSALHFDMKAIKASIRNSTDGAARGVFGFGLKSSDRWFVEMVRDLLVERFSAQYKSPVSLKPTVSDDIGRTVREVVMYRRALQKDSVLCVVDVDGVAEGRVGDFWEQVTAAFGDISRYLILLFVVSDAAEFPADIVELPPPTFDADDVAEWAESAVRLIEWPDALAVPWRQTLVEYSYYDGQFNARMFYEELGRTIKDMQFDRENFRKELQDKVNS